MEETKRGKNSAAGDCDDQNAVNHRTHGASHQLRSCAICQINAIIEITFKLRQFRRAHRKSVTCEGEDDASRLMHHMTKPYSCVL